ncbi:ABC transporter permease [Glycomyces algeriensis]|uniref:Membrane protein n=1 Tax=Glycomyces algeriensis TaxID=256037 RepID=A0A9W6GBC8_9ACTN|nr:ABC transporter permease [Glycomyces algeriensis]MDA1367281.1 ABC transporter permease [Glycomyces algeriensis]MDR7351067.1 putative ABC transport system permease protein [Glycomyces algeriensis]GLI43780.1 membrane protein [Glycomyces algeriensis]
MLRATLKGMASRKARLVLTSLAVVLGTMFVAAAMILTATMEKSVTGVIADAFTDVDAVVSSAEDPAAAQGNTPSATLIPGDVLETVRGVDGVESAEGDVSGQINAIGDDGKLVGAFAPTIGFNWNDQSTGLNEIRDGTSPQADDEVIVSTQFVKDAGLDIGDTVTAYSYTADRAEYEIVGVFGLSGDRDSIAGETQMGFTVTEAQRLLAQGEDAYMAIYVEGGDASTDDIAAAIGSDYRVQTGEEASEEAAQGFAAVADIMGYIFLGFGLVAVFVSVFLIINTFTIIVAQRQRELALLRAIGAARNQVVGSVLAEAAVIGVIASILGLGLGVLLGWGLSQLVSSTVMGGLAVQLQVPATALWALAVGIGVTVLSAFVPAIKASGVPPVAAMRDAVNPPKPLRGITIAGLAVTGVGGVLIALGLTDNLGDLGLGGFLSGVGIAFVGITLLTPILSRPLVALLGAVMSWSFAGRLGKLNAGRNPRRTAITASALMIAVALVTGIATLVSSFKETTTELTDSNLESDLIVMGQQGANIPTFMPETLAEIKALPDVAAVGDLYGEFFGAEIDAEPTMLYASEDLPTSLGIFSGTVADGSVENLPDDGLVVNESAAEDRGLALGDTVEVAFANDVTAQLQVTAILDDSQLTDGWWVSPAQIPNFTVPKPMQAYIQVDDGADVGAVQSEVEDILADEPEVSVTNNAQFVEQQTGQLDVLLASVQILLALAIIIAIIGVVNTLVLSVLERTRELGLLRAIGMTRGQARRMITVESVIICLFGAVLGIAVGIGLGWTVQQALEEEGLTSFALPWALIVTYLVAAVAVGLLAAIAPAARAAKLNVLNAIAYE